MALLTEDEAKSKWCALARAVDTHDAAPVTLNRSRSGPDVDCLCIASACMAWRWSDPATFDPADRRGFCGAFGSPTPEQTK